MKFSEAWLRAWVNPACDGDRLLTTIGMAGIEIEGIEPVDCGFEGVVVGLVEAVEPHPNADRLRVCTVFDGEQRHQVVCGAANVRAGMHVPFARLGASLKHGELRIKAAKLRGVDSAGMLCSASELNLAEQSSGLLELPAGSVPGTDLTTTFPARDRIVEVGLTPNRGDCLSLRGIAREVGVLFGAAVCEPACAPVSPTITRTFPVTIAAPEGCPRYLGRVVQGIDLTRPTPLWLRERLRRGGMRSIDPAVDVTNYVMLELGQPMHAFELGRLAGGIDVRWATAGECLEMLDGKQLQLRPETLVIADANGPVAMAGIMGGLRSGMQEGTERCDVFLESAFFAPDAIRGRARAHGLHTEASQRFERGVDFELAERALERATALLLEIAGGEAGPVVRAERTDALPVRGAIRLRHARLERLIGTAIPVELVASTLGGLGLTVNGGGTAGDAGVEWQVNAPSHRFDIEREEDLVEEVCRIYGYDRIPDAAPITSLELRPDDPFRTALLGVRRSLVGLGYQEAITYSFIDPATTDLFEPGVATVRLDNPLSLEMSVMRTSLVPGLVRAALYNHNRQSNRGRLFEIGRCFTRTEAGIVQPWRVAGMLVGTRSPEGWANGKGDVDFFDLKGDVERLLGADIRFVPLLDDPALHPGQAASLHAQDGRRVGRAGRVHPAVLEQLGLPLSVLVFEVELEALVGPALASYAPFSSFPSMRRDIAVLVGREVPLSEIEAAVRAAAGEQLAQFTCFDVYAGEGIDSEKKSIGLGLTFQHLSRTLEEAEVSTFVATVMQRLEAQFGASQR